MPTIPTTGIQISALPVAPVMTGTELVPVVTVGSITGITQAVNAVVTVNTVSSANPFSVGQQVYFAAVGGMAQINGQGVAASAVGGVSGAWTITVPINSSAFSAYTSGGQLTATAATTSALLPRAGGTYSATFLSGSIQIKGPNGELVGYGDFQFGRLLPNASGTPAVALLLGGAGTAQVVYLTDEQVPGQKGITVIREAGDVSSITPGTNDGGDLLDFAGASVNGQGGQSKYQGGTSVHGRAGDSVLHGGNSTNGTPGNGVVMGGETGTVAGSGVILAMIKPSGAPGFGDVSIIKGDGGFPGASTTYLIQFLSNGEIYLTASGTGAGLAGQPMVSGGIGAPARWQAGFTGTRTVGSETWHFNSGILTSIT